jgi:hypothetical protein
MIYRMALARCSGCGRPKCRTKDYVRAVEPVGYPDTAIICGSSGCEQAAVIWLDRVEQSAYKSGERVFQFPTHAVKVRVADAT